MSHMGKRTANLILLNSRNQVLLQLRDDIPTIPYPNTWCLPGGHIEGDETPEECLTREMREEMGIELPSLRYFTARQYPGETAYFFVAQADYDVHAITLTEGQAIAWFSREKVHQLDMAHYDGNVVEEFYTQADAEKVI